jgi:chromatin remodeling complex protein RSC6
MPSKSKSTTPRKAKSTSEKKTTKAVKAPVIETVTETPAVIVTSAVTETPTVIETATVVTETPEISLEDQFKDIIDRLQQFRSLSQTLMADVRKLQKNVNRQVRESSKKNRKRKNTGDTKRPPSGFAKPTLISDSLCQFLGVESGTMMARTEVTKHLTKYIKAHELQDQANRRIINCDSALAGLLNVKPSDEVTYFNLQRYMKPHFPQSAANLAAAAAAVAVTASA